MYNMGTFGIDKRIRKLIGNGLYRLDGEGLIWYLKSKIWEADPGDDAAPRNEPGRCDQKLSQM
jgi:hypothetical protein